jgi:hypothetical protein
MDSVRETHALPRAGHEHSLQYLYAMYGQAVRSVHRAFREHPDALGAPPEQFSRFVPLWERVGLFFNGQGVDAQIFGWSVTNDHVRFGAGVKDSVLYMRQIEVKIELQRQFNHCFLECDAILVGAVAAEIANVTDSQGNTAELEWPVAGDALVGVGFYLGNVRSGMRMLKSRHDRSEDLKIPVVVFPWLLQKTFESIASVELVQPHTLFEPIKGARGGGARARRA